MSDHVDHILEQWNRERPDLDFEAMGVIARISRLARFFERSIAGVLQRFAINEPGFAVLAALRRAGSPYQLSPTVLYNSLLVSSGAMTNRLDRLADAGLIERLPDPGDRRGLLVGLTAKGARVIDAAVAAHTENERRLLSLLSDRDREECAGLLRKLSLQFEIEPDPERAVELELEGSDSGNAG